MFEISGVGVITALGAGAISFLSPCVLPLVPGYLSYVAGSSVDDRAGLRRWATIGYAFVFCMGFSAVFVGLGAGAGALSRALLAYRTEAAVVGGVLIITFGLFTTGLAKLPWLQRDLRFHGQVPGGRGAVAFLLGVAFAFGWTPCIGPILGAILSVSAVSATVGSGVALLSIYAAGLAIPFLLAALFADRAVGIIRRAGRWGQRLNVAAGVVMIVIGVAMLTGQLTTFSFWLLETFPVFGRIG